MTFKPNQNCKPDIVIFSNWGQGTFPKPRWTSFWLNPLETFLFQSLNGHWNEFLSDTQKQIRWCSHRNVNKSPTSSSSTSILSTLISSTSTSPTLISSTSTSWTSTSSTSTSSTSTSSTFISPTLISSTLISPTSASSTLISPTSDVSNLIRHLLQISIRQTLFQLI